MIGPEYSEDYRWLLKIVLAAVALSVVISGVVQGLLQGDGMRILTEVVSSAVMGAVSAVGAVTILFMILERRKIRIDFRKEFGTSEKYGMERRNWIPALLPPIPDSKAVIKRSDEAVNLVFEALLAGLMIFAPWLFGAYVFENGTFIRTIPIVNLERWNIILPVLLIALAAGFADDVVRLVCGRYCQTVLIVCLVSGAVQAVFAWIMLKALPFFNPSFVEELRQEFGWQGTKGDLLILYGTGRLETIVLLVIWACILIEMGVTVYKTVKYAEKG